VRATQMISASQKKRINQRYVAAEQAWVKRGFMGYLIVKN